MEGMVVEMGAIMEGTMGVISEETVVVSLYGLVQVHLLILSKEISRLATSTIPDHRGEVFCNFEVSTSSLT